MPLWCGGNNLKKKKKKALFIKIPMSVMLNTPLYKFHATNGLTTGF